MRIRSALRLHRAPGGPRVASASLAVLLSLGSVATGGTRNAFAQQPAADTTAFYTALDLESGGKYREAVPYFRSALSGANAVGALLGLERVYAELGWADSLVAPVEALIRRDPRERAYRSVELRTLQTLGRDAELHAAVQRWIAAAPNDAAPYREYARLLIQHGLTASADSVIASARAALGGTGDLQLEIAQLRAASGQWEASAAAWRLALAGASYLEQAAVFALTPTPAATRPAVRRVLLAPPLAIPARRTLAALESSWGSPNDGWLALRDLPPDSAAASAWADFASRAEGEERWALARDALVAALRVRRTPELALRTAIVAVRAGDPQLVLRVLPLADAPRAAADSERAAREVVPLQARALAMLGRPADAERLVARYDRWLAAGERTALTRAIALGWVRSGDLARARASLGASADGDSSDAAGWLALYDGDLRTARRLLRTSGETTPELAAALAIAARVRADSAPTLGRAFLLLARNDSAGAAAAFVDAAERTPDATPALLAMAASLRHALRDDAAALTLWKRIVEQQGTSPEAPAAELEWARALRRTGDNAGAVSRLEHLILTYPQSALVPQARRELDLARSGIPGAA